MTPDQEMPQEQMQEGGAEEPGEKPQDDGGTRVILAAMKIIYDKSTSDGVVQMLTKAGAPVHALVQTSMIILGALMDQAKGRIPPDVLAQASGQVVTLLAELGDAAGVKMQDVADQAKQAVAQLLQQKLSGKPAGDAPADQPQPEAQPPAQPGGLIASAAA